MKRRLLKWAGLGLLLAVGGFAVMASGVVPIPASSGHWPITAWLLEFSKRRSVSTHTLGGEPLKLDAEWMVLKGAGHYATGCLPCHGARETEPFALIMNAARPQPPFLPHQLGDWKRDELFYLVKHGIKFTGMPAWPSQQRDDEVEAMVAFLERLPSLDQAGFEALVSPAPGTPGSGSPAQAPGVSTPPEVERSCLGCHGAQGGGRGLGAAPKLAGQHRAYLAAALEAYAEGRRHSGIMQPVAVGLSPEVRGRLADYYAALPPSGLGAAPPDNAAVERGRLIAQRGIPEQRVPTCIRCHGPKRAPMNLHYPSLEGQYREYLLLQLQVFGRGQRGGSKYAHLMQEVAAKLTDEQMRDVAAYYASLPAHEHLH